MILMVIPGVASADSITNSIEYYVNNSKVDSISSGNLKVVVNHAALNGNATVVGAIYENGRLFAVKAVTAGSTSTELPYGNVTTTSGKTYTFKPMYLASTETLELAKAASGSTNSTIYVQAEEFDTYTTRTGTTFTYDQVSSGWLAAGASIDDASYVSNGTAFPSENSGTGIPLNEWSTVYGVVWRGNANQTVATYTANVSTAGTYKMSLSAISWGNRDLNVTVNGVTKNVATIYDNSGWKVIEIGEFDFVAGDNTITFAVGTAGSYDIEVDYIALAPVSTEPVEVPTATAADDLYWSEDGVTVKDVVKVWNCTAPAGTDSVELTFNATRVENVDLTPIAGDATAAFQVLLFNTNGAAVTLDIQ